MQFQQIQKVPYSFSREEYNQYNHVNQKYTNQVQTNEPSLRSQFQDQNRSRSAVKNYNYLLKSLTEQMQYYKQALETAQNLIKNYQNETNNLREENIRTKNQLNHLSCKIQNIERLLLRVFSSQKISQQMKTESSSKSSFYTMGNQNLKSFYNNTDDQNCSPEIENKIVKLVNQQSKYEDLIFQLNKKVKHLQKFQQTSIRHYQKDKMKNSVYMPFVSHDGYEKQKQRVTRQTVHIYGNQNTSKTISTKQSDFKKNLQKEFEVFLQSKRCNTKNKNSSPKTISNFNKSSTSIYPSSEKKSKKVTSISKRK